MDLCIIHLRVMSGFYCDLKRVLLGNDTRKAQVKRKYVKLENYTVRNCTSCVCQVLEGEELA